MKKNLLLVAALFAGVISYAQCEAVATLNEDFSDFTITQSDAFPQNCWSANTGMPIIYTEESGIAADQYVVYYNMFTAGVAGYLVSPELSTLTGGYQLSFDTFKLAQDGTFPTGDMTVQAGTLSAANDFTTFVAIGEPFTITETSVNHANIVIEAAATQKFIAFKIIGSGIHNAAAIDNVVFDEVPAPPCVAVATLNENFNSFTPSTSVAIHENCWSANAGTPLIYVDGEEGNNYATFYAAGAANVAGYLVSPELISIDGDKQLSFDAFAIGNPAVVTTVQVGTLTSATDFTSFVAVSDVITLTATATTYDEIVIPASDAHKFIAFKVISDNAHGAAGIDNVNWNEVVAGIDDLNKVSFSIYPNPTADKNITISHNLDAKGSVNIYSLTGARVYTAELSNTGTQSFNLSSFTAGLYIVKIESGDYSESKKLIIQ